MIQASGKIFYFGYLVIFILFKQGKHLPSQFWLIIYLYQIKKNFNCYLEFLSRLIFRILKYIRIFIKEIYSRTKKYLYLENKFDIPIYFNYINKTENKFLILKILSFNLPISENENLKLEVKFDLFIFLTVS